MFSSSTNEKVAVQKNPFSQIVRLEEEQKKRKDEQVMRMKEEERLLFESLEKEKNKHVQGAKEKARNALQEYKQNDVANILKTAEKTILEELTSIDMHCQKKASILADELVATFCSPSFILSL